MLITLHTADRPMQVQLQALLRDLVGSDREQLLELELRPWAPDGGANLDDDVHCHLQAQLTSGARLSASHAAPTLVQALHGAVRQLRQALVGAAQPQQRHREVVTTV